MATAQMDVYRALKTVATRIFDPLRKDEHVAVFTLSIPDAQTTVGDSVQGWLNRPPASFRCPGCDGVIVQEYAIDTLDCRDCFREYPDDEFGDHDLIHLTCPRCESQMVHGTRHPGEFDVPEWATCPSCQYHWDLDHWY